MAAAGLIIAILTLSTQLTQDMSGFIQALNTMHQHSTSVVYRHVVKPVGKGIKKTTKKVVTDGKKEN